MADYKYVGAHASYTIAGILFVKDAVIALQDDQVAALKQNGVGKALIANGSIVAVEVEPAKSIDDMTVAELKVFITDNGGEFDSDDNKPDLLAIAHALAD